jgi:hypothetical protein
LHETARQPLEQHRRNAPAATAQPLPIDKENARPAHCRASRADRTLKARQEKEEATGKKPGGRPPAPPQPGPGAADQVNLTGEDSHVMPVAGGGFEQAYNAQAVVAEGSLLVVASDVTQAVNDKQQIEPMLGKARPAAKRLLASPPRSGCRAAS